MQADPQTTREMARAIKPPRARQPWMPLVGAVLKLAGPDAQLLRHIERPWSSVTFSGTRHTIALAFTGNVAQAQGEAFIAALPEHEFAVPRQIVADATVVAVTHQLVPEPRIEVEMELLLVEDL